MGEPADVPKNPSPRTTSRIVPGVRGGARSGTNLCRGHCCARRDADLRLPSAAAARVRWVPPSSGWFPTMGSTGKPVAFVMLFPPSFDPPAVTAGFIYPGWSGEQHALTWQPPKFLCFSPMGPLRVPEDQGHMMRCWTVILQRVTIFSLRLSRRV